MGNIVNESRVTETKLVVTCERGKCGKDEKE